MRILIFLLLTIGTVCQAQDEQYNQFVLRSSLPDDINYNPKNKNFFKQYNLRDKPNPFYQRGDFNGDGKLDYAISIVNVENNKSGIALFLSNTAYEVIGAGKPFEDGRRDDFWWMDAWQVYTMKDVDMGVGESEKLSLTTDALLVIKTESSSGIVYWDGKQFHWYQQGD